MNATASNAMDCTGFFRDVESARTRILMVNCDGAVASFHEDHHGGESYSQGVEFLRRIATSCSTRVIVISGRAVREIYPVLNLFPSAEIWGRNGLETIDSSGCYREVSVSEPALAALAEAESRLELEGLGEYLEVTLAGVALHWNGTQPAEVLEVKAKAYRVLEPLAVSPELCLGESEDGMEIRLASADIGCALRQFLSKVEPGVPVAYLGCEPVDEEAFNVVNSRGLSVLLAPRGRDTAAQLSLKTPGQLVRFLTQWIHACGGNG
jgi:trehalose-phosphatase